LVQHGNKTTAWFHPRQIPNQSLNSTAWVAYRAHGSVNSVNILILKHRHGLVTYGWLWVLPMYRSSS